MSWPLKSLDELGSVGRGRSRHRPRDAAHLYDGPYPFIQTGDIKHANLYIRQFNQTYSEAGLAQSRLWKSGTLCITIAANIADTAILGIDACFPDSVIGFIPEPDKADVRFIKYLFDALLKKRFQQFTHGAAQDNLSETKLLSLKFPVPDDVMIQKRIADVLCNYDDLIENSLHRIELLEQAARLLYKEWFVHLRFPGHEHVKITDGLPERWEQFTLARLITFTKGRKPSVIYESESEELLPQILVDSFSGKQSGFAHPDKMIVCKENDILMLMDGARSGLVVRGYAGVVGSTLARVDISEEKFSNVLFEFLSSRFEDINQKTRGTAIPHADKKYVSRMKINVPKDDLLLLFNDYYEAIFSQLQGLRKQIIILKRARDLILPRLMNGEIIA